MNSRNFVSSILISSIVFLNSIVSVNAFSDVKQGDWYAGYTQSLVVAGVIDGSKLTFDPLAHVTRDVAAKIVVKAAGYEDKDLIAPLVPSFHDVSKSSWAYSYVETAKSLGFVSGYGNEIFGPSNEVSRAEFAAMIVRAFKLKKNIDGKPVYTDVSSSDWFYDDIETVFHWSIVSGYGDGSFKPYSPINRAEMSKIVVKAMNLLVVESKKVIEPIEKPVAKTVEKIIVKPVKSSSSSGGSGGGTSGIPVEPVISIPDVPVIVPNDDPIISSFLDDFSSFTPQYYPDSATFAPWLVQFGGFGTVGIETDGNNKFLHLSPQVADLAGVTHASLVTGPLYSGAIQLTAKLLTVAQLRTGSTPNPWEVAWIVWNYTNDKTFYYFIPKTNGWELGKRDSNYPGGQRFLATGDTPAFPIGQWYDVKIEQDASNLITVWVDGVKITTFTDTETPYTSGNIGFYTEDAHVHVDDVIVKY